MASREAEILSLLDKLSAQIIGVKRRPDSLNTVPHYSDTRLAEFAGTIYAARVQRASRFGTTLFGEPAWDMLLDLFINCAKGLRLGTTSLCLGSGAPQSTALRYIERLEADGLLRRYQPVDDRRLNCVELTPRGKKLMREYLSTTMAKVEAASA